MRIGSFYIYKLCRINYITWWVQAHPCPKRYSFWVMLRIEVKGWVKVS